MRTTVEISEVLMRRVRRLMQKQGCTFRNVVERGLERILRDESPECGFVLRTAAFDGQLGFAPGTGADDVPKAVAAMNEDNTKR